MGHKDYIQQISIIAAISENCDKCALPHNFNSWSRRHIDYLNFLEVSALPYTCMFGEWMSILIYISLFIHTLHSITSHIELRFTI